MCSIWLQNKSDALTKAWALFLGSRGVSSGGNWRKWLHDWWIPSHESRGTHGFISSKISSNPFKYLVELEERGPRWWLGVVYRSNWSKNWMKNGKECRLAQSGHGSNPRSSVPLPLFSLLSSLPSWPTFFSLLSLFLIFSPFLFFSYITAIHSFFPSIPARHVAFLNYTLNLKFFLKLINFLKCPKLQTLIIPSL